jgi:UPF0716 protein FxsA
MNWLLFIYPWLELWSLIELGSQTTSATAILWVLGAGILGIALFRFAGRQALEQLQQAQREGVLSQQLLIGNVAQLVTGVLLIVPGLISDALAVVVLIAPLRILLAKLLFGRSANTQSAHYQEQGGSSSFRMDAGNNRFDDGGVTLEGEFEPVSPESGGADREKAVPLEHNPTERD